MFMGRDRRRSSRPRVRIEDVDYKNIEVLRRFVTDQGKILPRKATHVGSIQQRRVAREVKRARHLALLPFCSRHK